MRYLLLLLAFLGFNDGLTPKETAVLFTKHFNKLEFEEAKKYSTTETAKMLDMLSAFSSMVPDSVKDEAKNKKVEAIDEKIDGDNAVVVVLIGGSEEEKVNLIKVNDVWLVQQSKEDDTIELEE